MRPTWQSHQVIPIPGAGDPDPNSSPPSAARVFLTLPDEAALLLLLEDGTSATFAVWCYDLKAALWIQVATGQVLATAPVLAPVEANAQTFVQLTALVGPPTLCIVGPSGSGLALLAQLLGTAPGTFNWDEADLHYTAGDLDVVTYKLAGATVRTATITWVGGTVTKLVWS